MSASESDYGFRFNINRDEEHNHRVRFLSRCGAYCVEGMRTKHLCRVEMQHNPRCILSVLLLCRQLQRFVILALGLPNTNEKLISQVRARSAVSVVVVYDGHKIWCSNRFRFWPEINGICLFRLLILPWTAFRYAYQSITKRHQSGGPSFRASSIWIFPIGIEIVELILCVLKPWTTTISQMQHVEKLEVLTICTQGVRQVTREETDYFG